MLWAVIAAVAALIAAACALATVIQTARLRRDEHLRTLADALITMISATEKNPGHGVDSTWDARVAEAVRQIERASGLSLLGLSAQITEPFLDLLDPTNQEDPQKLFVHATRAFEQLLAEEGVPRRTEGNRRRHPLLKLSPADRSSRRTGRSS